MAHRLWFDWSHLDAVFDRLASPRREHLRFQSALANWSFVRRCRSRQYPHANNILRIRYHSQTRRYARPSHGPVVNRSVPLVDQAIHCLSNRETEEDVFFAALSNAPSCLKNANIWFQRNGSNTRIRFWLLFTRIRNLTVCRWRWRGPRLQREWLRSRIRWWLYSSTAVNWKYSPD